MAVKYKAIEVVKSGYAELLHTFQSKNFLDKISITDVAKHCPTPKLEKISPFTNLGL